MPQRQPITAFVRKDEVRVDADAMVPWWSIAKTVLAGAASRLVAEGRLPLHEPVRGRSFTLRQLLQHRAGLRCYGTSRAYKAAVAAGGQPWSAGEMLRRVGAATLSYEPGQGWAYSNVGYFLVRRIIEEDTGMPLGAALERLVFGPLGVCGVTVARDRADLDATAWGNARRYHPGWVYHGLLVGPPGAAALFLHRLLAGNLLPPDLLGRMCCGHPVGGALPGRPWRTASHGLGLMIGQGEPTGECVGHTGGGSGSTAAVCRLAGRDAGMGAAFAPVEDPGPVEARALQLAAFAATLGLP